MTRRIVVLLCTREQIFLPKIGRQIFASATGRYSNALRLSEQCCYRAEAALACFLGQIGMLCRCESQKTERGLDNLVCYYANPRRMCRATRALWTRSQEPEKTLLRARTGTSG